MEKRTVVVEYAQDPSSPEIWTATWQQQGERLTYTGRPAKVEAHVNRMLAIAYAGEVLDISSREVPFDQLGSLGSSHATR